MSDVFKIALSGGPCSGKSTIIDKLNKHYADKGYNVVVIPESARQILEQGATRDDMYSFELQVAQKQLENEKCVEQIDSDKDTIILYDRGLTDAFGYLDEVGKSKLAKDLGISLIQSWSRYEAVLFLETAALSGCYIGDENRDENEEQAVESHDAILDVWMGHPHLRYIESTSDFDAKLVKVIAEIDAIINNIEHEIKYLVEYPNLNELKKYKQFATDIEQIYLLSDKGSHRIRKRGAGEEFQYFETLKIRITGDSCFEYENDITFDEYNELKKLANPKKHPIVKKRICLLYKSQYFELDLFPFWDDKALIELELSENNQQVELPPEIKVIKDVSSDHKYKNNYLAGLKL